MIAATFPQSLFNHGLAILAVVAPFAIYACVVHWLELTLQKRLAERFGWRSVLWTGWLGTPIHELSHVLMCVVFRHRVDQVSLFEPDPNAGRLGFVRHSWRKGNWFEELGNFFIGIAPLIGGSAVLILLFWMFYPESMSHVPAEPTSDWILIQKLLSEVFRPENLLSLRLWIFVYLVLCVGSHMAPSWSDYQGATRGLFLLAVIFVVAIVALSLFQVDSTEWLRFAFQILSPVFSLLILAALLCGTATLIVYIIVGFWPQKYRVE